MKSPLVDQQITMIIQWHMDPQCLWLGSSGPYAVTPSNAVPQAEPNWCDPFSPCVNQHEDGPQVQRARIPRVCQQIYEYFIISGGGSSPV